MLKTSLTLFCVGCVICLALADPLQSRSESASTGFVLFAPKDKVESAFGQKLEHSNSRYSAIHASGRDFDYFHYTYDVVGTSGSLLIAYYTFWSDEGAKRELRRLTQDRSFTVDQVLGNTAWFFGGSKQEPGGANLAVRCKNDLILINANTLKADDATRARLKCVAQLLLDPKLRGHIRE